MGTLKERVDAELKDAMRSKYELTTSVLRMLKSAIKYKEVEPGGKPKARRSRTRSRPSFPSRLEFQLEAQQDWLTRLDGAPAPS